MKKKIIKKKKKINKIKLIENNPNDKLIIKNTVYTKSCENDIIRTGGNRPYLNKQKKITPIQKNGIINVHGRENKNKTKLKNTTLRLISIITKKQKNTNLNKLVFSSESTSINSLKDVPFNVK